MNPITLPTSPETRANFTQARWRLHKESRAVELWHDPDGLTAMAVYEDGYPQPYPANDHCAVSVRSVLEFAAILGIAPNGYRLIPEEIAAEYLAASGAFYGQRDIDDPEATMKNWGRLERAQEALNAALGGSQETFPSLPRPSENGGLSPSPTACEGSILHYMESGIWFGRVWVNGAWSRPAQLTLAQGERAEQQVNESPVPCPDGGWVLTVPGTEPREEESP